ncbi:MAG TPA: chalcone isomerase family protein [Gemmatimonadales bacterium]|nr:chalcone isomerase family protein [Gemmatimonadales bacterium]
MIATLLLVAAFQSPAVTEPNTKVSFPIEIETAAGMHALAGTGVRTRTFLQVKVYAFGLYVDPASARTALSAWRGKSANDLAHDQSFYDTLLKGSFPMTMRLVMTRNVGGAQMAEAFDGALAPRVAQAATRGMAGGAEALTTFRSFFTDKLSSGTELLFTWAPGNKLVASIGGRRVGEIENAALCWALFDVYLGSNPISSEGKKTVIARLPELIGG